MHTGPLIIDLGILKLNNIKHYVLQLFMFRFHTRKLPAIFDDMFTKNDDIHSHDTRQRFHPHVPFYCNLDVYKEKLKMYLHKHQSVNNNRQSQFLKVLCTYVINIYTENSE